MNLPSNPLPRLLYIGDVPVESSYHGSALIYRLLQNYPAERLQIVEGTLRNSLPERRLPGVCYRSVKVGWKRPLYTRFSRWVHLAYSYAAGWKANAIEHVLNGFQPEAVLTVAHDFLWITAARYARQHSLPLHLICHDDWPRLALMPSAFRGWLEGKFARVYRQATSRLCVSPYMMEEYERRYGPMGTVLYPCRAADAPQFAGPPGRFLKSNGSLTVAFAGTINSPGYVSALQNLAHGLERMGGRLLIFGPLKKTEAEASRLIRANVELCGMVPSAELMHRLRAEVDVLFVPMSFAPGDREYSALSFPSKLTDYTAAGLPLLIYGPDYCSAVRWAREHPGIAEVVAEESGAALNSALERLSQLDSRRSLAEAAARYGNSCFSHPAGWRAFCVALSRAL